MSDGGVLILSDGFMNAIKFLLQVFIWISIIYTLSIGMFTQKVFEFFKVQIWKSFIPFYNLYVLLKALKLPEYYILLLFFPIGNIGFIFYMSTQLTKYFDKNPDYAWGIMFAPFIYIPALITNKGKLIRASERKKPKVIQPKYSMKDLDANLLTDKEIENLNQLPSESEDIDSIFKADIEMLESASPYKAGKQKVQVIQEEPKYERETIKKVEAVKARDIKRDGKFIKEEDVIEKVDL